MESRRLQNEKTKLIFKEIYVYLFEELENEFDSRWWIDNEILRVFNEIRYFQ